MAERGVHVAIKRGYEEPAANDGTRPEPIYQYAMPISFGGRIINAFHSNIHPADSKLAPRKLSRNFAERPAARAVLRL